MWRGGEDRVALAAAKGTLRNFGMGMLVLVMGAAGCGDSDDGGEIGPPVAEGPEAPIRIASVDLGRSVDAEMRINDGLPTDEFALGDTIFASVATDGTLGNAIVTARWIAPGDEVMSEAARAISPTGPMILAFPFTDPEGLDAGQYELTILLDGVAVESRDFTIR